MNPAEAIFSAGVAKHVMDYFVHPPVAPVNAAALSQLSERKREVLTLIAQGLTNAAIAERLVLSPKTVRNYISETTASCRSPIASRLCCVHGNLASEGAYNV